MHLGLGLLLVAFVLAAALLLLVLIASAARWATRTTPALGRLSDQSNVRAAEMRDRLTHLREGMAAGDAGLAATLTRLTAFDDAAADLEAQLIEQRRTIDRTVDEQVLPVLRWLARLVLIARVVKLQRSVFG